MEAELTRTVRFCLEPDGSLASDRPTSNSFAGWPPMRGLGRYYELHVTCAGPVDPVTGYLVNIKQIDQAVREAVLPRIAEAARRDGGAAMGRLLQTLLNALHAAMDVPRARRLVFQLTPYHSYAIEDTDMAHLLIAQQYDFSAAHRLHVADLSDRENREVFGKCNNPSGHGHNYCVEVAVRAAVDDTGRALPVEQLDALVDERIIEKFDHKHLNCDLDEFAELNPSVENIAKVIYDTLGPAVRNRLDAELEHVRVWETGKTACLYRGD
jgi:6-pyruvoyltetrahydropterin/6-carboxytetrahydropterin synthase